MDLAISNILWIFFIVNKEIFSVFYLHPLDIKSTNVNVQLLKLEMKIKIYEYTPRKTINRDHNYLCRAKRDLQSQRPGYFN